MQSHGLKARWAKNDLFDFDIQVQGLIYSYTCYICSMVVAILDLQLHKDICISVFFFILNNYLLINILIESFDVFFHFSFFFFFFYVGFIIVY
jgi:hypothetical protein